MFSRIALVLLAALAVSYRLEADTLAELDSKIRLSRPRLFITPTTVAHIREHLTPHQTRFLKELCKDVGRRPLSPTLAPVKDGDAWGTVNDWGHPAQAAAVAWLLTSEPKYLAKAESWLKWSANWYTQRFANHKAVSWYAHSRRAALAAYDWIYGELDEDTRISLGQQLLEHIAKARDRSFIRSVNGEGSSGPTAGYYGTANLFWYAGIVFFKAGVDDALAEELLVKGYEEHRRMFELRARAAGDSGGPIPASTGYALGDYWKQELNFFCSWEAATGTSCVGDFPNLALLPEWVFRTAIPTAGGICLDYGTGDCPHFDNRMRFPIQYLAQFPRFYADQAPVQAAIADYMLACLPAVQRDPYEVYRPFLKGHHADAICPFLFDVPRMDERSTADIVSQLPKAKHYPQLGQTFSRSGLGSDSTFALFTAGARTAGHKHFDEGHFTIYKHGYQALDTGARLVYSGMVNNERLQTNCRHNRNYFLRTVAHNCILIHDPDEDFGTAHVVHGITFPLVNDGGMRERIGSTLLAFGATDKTTYAAADITGAYSTQKAVKVIRHFLHVQPDAFVIYDFVRSAKPAFRKAWLLHTMGKPEAEGNAFQTREGDGQIRVQAILPEQAVLTPVGGPGADFVSGGVNWPVAPEDEKNRQSRRHLYGNWRVEIAPPEPAEITRFLTFIQVGAAASAEFARAERVPGGAPALRFALGNNNKFEVAFNADGAAGGSLSINGEAEALPTTVTDPMSPEHLKALGEQARGLRR